MITRISKMVQDRLRGKVARGVSQLNSYAAALREKGHTCHIVTTSGTVMKRMLVKMAKDEHKAEAKYLRSIKEDAPPPFDPDSVDVSDIEDESDYFVGFTFGLKQCAELNPLQFDVRLNSFVCAHS